MKKYFKVTRPTLGKMSCVVDLPYAIEELTMSVENDEIGDLICFETIEMDENDYKNLDEFGGW